VAEPTAHALAKALRVSLRALGPRVHVDIGAVEIHRATSVVQVMSAADLALAGAESRGAFAVEIFHVGAADILPRGEQSWRAQISAALVEGRTQLAEFPVLDRAGGLIHLECPLRLQLEPGGAFEPATRWLPLALRSRLTSMADAHAVALALQSIRRDGRARCVNLAPVTLNDGAFVAALRELLRNEPEAARFLSLEFGEPAALERFALLQSFGRDLRPLGVRLGLEHAGERLAQVDRLFEAGLDYVKLDVSVTRGVGSAAERADFVKSSVALLHGLSLPVYAEGVVNDTDLRSLWSCGVDGATGPWITEQSQANAR
jgi:EAL domain-containing protein (putative c-di-GMP-specific phosphodiesterase class I)